MNWGFDTNAIPMVVGVEDGDGGEAVAVLEGIVADGGDGIGDAVVGDGVGDDDLAAVAVVGVVAEGHSGIGAVLVVVDAVHLEVVGGGLRHGSERKDESKQ